MDIDLVIIDCEGTLLDCEGLRARVLGAAFSDLGAWVPKGAIMAVLAGRSLAKAAELLAVQHDVGLPPGFAARCDYALKVRCRGQVAPSPGIGRVLDMARVPVCLTAASRPDVALALLRAAGLAGLTPCLESPKAGLAPYPAPECLIELAARKRVAPDRILIIDDSPAAMIAGLTAGMSTLLYTALAPGGVRAAWSRTGTLDHWDDFPDGLLWPQATARVC